MPWFLCTAAIMLLQHGVDPKWYKIGDVLHQLQEHFRFYRFFHGDYNCIEEETFLTTFLAAGYDLTVSDMNCCKEYFDRSNTDIFKIMHDYSRPSSLKHLVRAKIRNHIRSVNMDTSVFPVIDKLTLPTILQDFLKLYDVSPSDMTSMICYKDSPINRH
ncbi:SOCS5 [Mytilus edulis]|uniref:SOCS5 n=1 Tax=Mytilus edulis TaxID=6550 RepID=A0A8S3VNA6_MYTED|nr:SOCS5 [Mytilus edulis]